MYLWRELVKDDFRNLLKVQAKLDLYLIGLDDAKIYVIRHAVALN